MQARKKKSQVIFSRICQNIIRKYRIHVQLHLSELISVVGNGQHSCPQTLPSKASWITASHIYKRQSGIHMLTFHHFYVSCRCHSMLTLVWYSEKLCLKLLLVWSKHQQDLTLDTQNIKLFSLKHWGF